ncbi:MAG TPA: GNAT family N-acetyltransferase [Dehalococcoidales bacterium]|nr:GNAT family N-acetyltransferase [Dehalococcoidales bacterium]
MKTFENLESIKQRYPDKFASEEFIFSNVHRGDRIFIASACGEPQYLVSALIRYAQSYPKAFFDAEVIHIWTLGLAPYTEERFKYNFRHNSFFIGNSTRDAVNRGMADYTPVFLSEVPAMFQGKFIPIDAALIQVSPPDEHGYMSLGVSVDIVKDAVEQASLIIAQVNSAMPRTLGDGFIHISKVNYLVPHDEPILEYRYRKDARPEVTQEIGNYVSRLVEDGDTIQVGYGSVPNNILVNLAGKKHLGVHTELVSDGLVELMKMGVIDNSMKTIDNDKTIASFCMGSKETYDYVDDNPLIEFKTINYTNNILVVSQIDNFVAINSALEIDLTGQATAESLGKTFYSGMGGQADFMRGAVHARRGRAILAMPSTTTDGSISRIVPFLKEGAGVTLNRGDVHYVVTEYGIAYLHGKNIRERAMELISIAHPKFRKDLIQQAKAQNLIYKDQAFIPGKPGEYPKELETHRTTRAGLEITFRPVKISDEPLLKDMFYALSDNSMYRRFFSPRTDMPHERLQEFVVIDYSKEISIVATIFQGEKEIIIGIGQYIILPNAHVADIAFVVRDEYQNKGVGNELLSYLTYLAKRQGLLGFIADVLVENRPMLHLFEKQGFFIEKKTEGDMYELRMTFSEAKTQ